MRQQYFAKKGNFNMPYDYNYSYNPYGSFQQPRQNTYAFVNGIEGAKSFILQPNQTVLLMDSEQPVCYMKQANGLGQSTLRYFKLTEVNEADIRGNNNIQAVKQDFVSKSEFDELCKKFEKLSKKLEVKKDE